MDKIIIQGLRIFAFHGVNPPEKLKGQPFELDIVMELPLEKPGRSDRLEETVNYSSAVKLVQRVMTEEKYDLIERAAQQTADALLAEFPEVVRVELTLKKPRAPIAADFDYVAVQIRRERKG